MQRESLAVSRQLAIFAGAAIAGCMAFRALAPFPQIPQVSAKLEAFSDGKHYDAAFFGTSKIYSGVIPKLFDENLSARGFNMRSFNLGIDGMSFPENGYLAEQALARCPWRVKWVFIEATTIRTAIAPRYRGTRRIVYWHDARRTLETLRAIQSEDFRVRRPNQPRAKLLQEHALLFGRWLGNLGDGAALLGERFIGREKPGPRDVFDPGRRGYLPMHEHMNKRDEARFESALADFGRSSKLWIDRVSEEALRSFAKRIECAGARPIFLVPANAEATAPIFQKQKGRANPVVLAFDDPALYPQLYRVDNRADFVHLNDAGAREFTQLLAKRFADLLTGAP